MTRLLLKIYEYPSEIDITEEELNLEGRREIIRECQSMIDRLEGEE